MLAPATLVSRWRAATVGWGASSLPLPLGNQKQGHHLPRDVTHLGRWKCETVTKKINEENKCVLTGYTHWGLSFTSDGMHCELVGTGFWGWWGCCCTCIILTTCFCGTHPESGTPLSTSPKSPIDFCPEKRGKLDWPEWKYYQAGKCQKERKGRGYERDENHEGRTLGQVTYRKNRRGWWTGEWWCWSEGIGGPFGVDKSWESGNKWTKVEDLLLSSRGVYLPTLFLGPIKSCFY